MFFKVYATHVNSERQELQAGYGVSPAYQKRPNEYRAGGGGGNATQGRRITRSYNQSLRARGLSTRRKKNPRARNL